MIIAIFLVLISCYLEGTLSTYIPLDTYFLTPLFTWLACLLCQSFFLTQKKYFWFCFGVGIFYDIVYTDTLLFHAILFVVTAYFFKKISVWLSTSKLNFIFSIIINIFIYQTLSYIILLSIGYLKWNLTFFIEKLISSFLLNILYGILISLLFTYLEKRQKHFTKQSF